MPKKRDGTIITWKDFFKLWKEGIENLSPEQKKFLQDMTGQEGHRVTRLDSYTDNSSAQARLEKIKQEAF